MSTLKERLLLVTKDLPRGWKAELARLCGIATPSVSGWISGASQSIDGKHLTTVSEYFKVNPHWLATGEGNMNARDYKITAEPGHYELPKSPVRENEPSPAAMELAMLYDEIPATDRIRRAMAYNAASAAILDVLQEKQSSGA